MMAGTPDNVAQTLGLGAHRRFGSPWLKYAIALAIMVLGAAYWFLTADTRADIRYYTEKAVVGNFSVTVTATGTVEPTNLVEISSELSGTLETVHVDYNDIVEVGTILAELDTTKLQAQLAVSKAALSSSIARVAMARATLEDVREKYETGQSLQQRGVNPYQTLVSQKAAFNRAQSELQSAIADQALAEANLDLRQAELDKACICSPIRGVVLNRAADEGQIVASSLSAPILFTVAEDLTKMELHVDIDEADIGQVAVGNKATFTVDTYDDRQFPAEIADIRLAPETIDGVVTYKAILTIDNSDLLLRPGMTANADITVNEITGALVVPNAALRYNPPRDPGDNDQERSGLLGMLIPSTGGDTLRADGKTLWVLKDGVAQEIAVRSGATDGRVTQILQGPLSEGDQVITDQTDE